MKKYIIEMPDKFEPSGLIFLNLLVGAFSKAEEVKEVIGIAPEGSYEGYGVEYEEIETGKLIRGCPTVYVVKQEDAK